MGLSIIHIIKLSAKIYSIERTKGLLPCPTEGEARESLIQNKTIQNYKSFTPEEIKFMQENKVIFPEANYPKIHTWLQDTSKTLSDEFKNAEPAIKPNSEYPLLANLELYTRLSGESRFFNEQTLKNLHNRLAQFIGKDDPNLFRKANKLIEAVIASDADNPFHDFFIKLKLPAADKKWDKEKWYNFVINQGSKALLYLARADEIEFYLGMNDFKKITSLDSDEGVGLDEIESRIQKSAQLQIASRVPTNLDEAIEALVEISYDRAKEIELAENLPAGVSKEDLRDYTEYCVLHGIEPEDYDIGLDILLGNEIDHGDDNAKIKLGTNIPRIIIEGKDIADKYYEPELAKYRLEVLKPQDWRMLVMGELTNCCQSIGNDAEDCAIESMTNENTGVVAIFKGDKIVAQSFVWLGEEDEQKQKTFVFDSWERLNKNLNFLCAPFYNEMADKLKADHGIDKVTLGTGGNTPRNVFSHIEEALVKYKDKQSPYYDSEKQYRIIDTSKNVKTESNVLEINTEAIFNKFSTLIQAKKSTDFINLLQKISDDKELMNRLLESRYTKSKNGLLRLFCINGEAEVVDLLLNKYKADLSKNEEFKGELAFEVAALGFSDVLLLLIEHMDDVKVTKKYSGPLLFVAAGNGNGAVIKELVSRGEDVNIESNTKTPLYKAIEYGNFDTFITLLELGASIRSVSKYDSALEFAVQNVREDMVNELLRRSKSEDINVNELALRAINYHSEYNDTAKDSAMNLLKDFVDRGASLDPLIAEAFKSSKYEFMKFLFQKGANFDLNSKSLLGDTLLHIAVEAGDLEFVKELLEKGANINEKDSSGNTTLHLAIKKEFTQIVKHLVEKNADINSVNKDNQSPLNLAKASKKSNEIAAILTKHGAVEKEDTKGKLVAAAMTNNVDEAKRLLSIGANVNEEGVSMSIITPLSVALKSQNTEMMRLLLEHGANPNKSVDVSRDQRNGSFEEMKLLHIAADDGYVEGVRILLEQPNIEATATSETYGGSDFTAAELAKTPEIKQMIEDHIKAKAAQQRLLKAASNQTPDAALGSTCIPSTEPETAVILNSTTLQPQRDEKPKEAGPSIN